MSWHWLIVAFLLGLSGGYILKDQLTDEYVSNVTMNKPKVKGRGNKLDADQVTEVHLKKMSWKEKQEARKKAKENS